MIKTPMEQVEAGQAVYTPKLLSIYDLLVLGVSNRLIWRCPTPLQLEHYHRHVSANHLDVGVGTGYFLDHCRFPSLTPRIGLMDLNPNSLTFTAQRIARYQPETYQRNVLEPIAFDGEKFDSVGVNYLLHCLPGSMDAKAVLFDCLKPLLNPGAVIFGTTLLHEGVRRNPVARQLMAFYNRKGVFSNQGDDVVGLTRELNRRFVDVNVEVVGCGALFAAGSPNSLT